MKAECKYREIRPGEGQFDINLDDEGDLVQLMALTDGALIDNDMGELIADAINRLIHRFDHPPKETKRKRLQSQLAALQEEEARAAQRIEGIQTKRAEIAARLETTAPPAR